MKKVRLAYNSYTLVSQAVEDGLARTARRLFKYLERPPQADAIERIVEEQGRENIMNELSEVIDWERSR
jgi:hypothetical protein